METIKEMILGNATETGRGCVEKDSDQHLTDEIGCFFLEHNVFEFNLNSVQNYNKNCYNFGFASCVRLTLKPSFYSFHPTSLFAFQLSL